MPATNPDSGSLTVTADLSNLGLSATTPLYDDGTHGDTVAGDHTYSLATAATGGNVGVVPGLIVTAIDPQQNTAQKSDSVHDQSGNAQHDHAELTADRHGWRGYYFSDHDDWTARLWRCL